MSGGNNYIRLPAGGPTDPNAGNIKVNVSEAALYVKGSPKVTCRNVIFAFGGAHTIYAGSGSVYLENCGVEWSESNGIQLATGAVYMRGGWVKNIYNDCINRGLPAGLTSPSDTPWESTFDDVEIGYTIAGDGWSDHALEVAGARSKARFDRCRIHDVNKDGVVPASCDVEIYNTRLERCANAAVEVITGNNASYPDGLRARVVIRGCTLDPGQKGLYGLLMSGSAGGIMDVDLSGSWIGTPKTGGSEIRVATPTPVTGRTHNRDNWVLRYYSNCGTERPAASRVVIDPGSNARLIPVAFNALT